MCVTSISIKLFYYDDLFEAIHRRFIEDFIILLKMKFIFCNFLQSLNLVKINSILHSEGGKISMDESIK